MLEVVVDTQSLSRSGKGSITGQVFLRGPTGDFPEDGWSDFPLVVLTWWIEGMHSVATGKERSYQGLFMDGPFAFVVQRGPGASGRIAWGKRGDEASIGIVDIPALLRSAVTAGQQVANSCRARGWTSHDLENLEQAIARSAL